MPSPIPIDALEISAIEMIIGHKFTDLSIIWEALRAARSGVFRIGNRQIVESSKILELVGDATLRLVRVEIGYEEGADRGAINSTLSSTNGNTNLARVCFEKKLYPLICMNPAHIKHIPLKKMAIAVQAILGVVYLDSGVDLSIFTHFMKSLGLSESQ